MTQTQAHPSKPKSILFACSLNAVRSPMAEGLAKTLLSQKIYVDSAGLSTNELDQFAVAVMAEIGIDITNHNTQCYDDISVEQFDLIVALSKDSYVRAKALTRNTAVEVEFWETEDPTAQNNGSRESRLAAYRTVRDKLRKTIRSRFGSED
jgi:protein-tyrosine-phosphatase